MRFLYVCHGEALKALGSRAFVLGSAVVPLVFLIQVLGLALWSNLNPQLVGNEAQRVLSFPGATETLAELLGSFGRLAAAIGGSVLVGSEYTADMWKALIPRLASRSLLLAAKAVIGALTLLAITAAGLVIAALAWALGVALFGSVVLDRLSAPAAAAEALRIAGALVELSFYGALGMTAALITRSPLVGAIVAVVAPAPLYLVTFLGHLPALVLPNVHLQNLYAFTAGEAKLLAAAAAMFGTDVSPLLSLGVVALYVALLAALSCALLERRDFTGTR